MLDALEKALAGEISSSLSPEMAEIFAHWHEQDYSRAYILCRQQYSKNHDPEVKSFLLHLICSILENKYDLRARSEWMLKWPSQIAMNHSQFTIAAHRFHLAVSCYFESYYSESEMRFKEILSSEAPLRFKALAHFHLGLIYRNRQLVRGAQIEMRMALKIGTELNHKRLIQRSTSQLIIIGNDLKFSLLNRDLRELLHKGELKLAKKCYLSKRRIEIQNGIHRERQTLHAFLPVFAALEGQWTRAYALLEHISDYPVKGQVIKLIFSLGKETPELRSLEKSLNECFAMNPLEQKQDTGEIIFLGKSLNKIESEDLAKFTLYIYENSIVNKEEICRHVWNLDYDPVIHDGKIYKLIHQFRNYFGAKDLIVNRYGKYEINRRYRA